MKKIILPVIIIAVLLSGVLIPQHGEAASRLDELNKKIKELQAKERQAQNIIKKNQKDIKNIEIKTNQTKNEINYLAEQIDVKAGEIKKKESEIQQTTETLQTTTIQLEEAEKRVEMRDDLLRSRLRLMYTNGAVSYLEVLFTATSFKDFLERYQSLTMIVGQDKDILEENLNDKSLIAANKLKVEQDLTKLSTLYAELEKEKANLQVKEHNKEVMVAQLQDKKESLEEISEEEEALLIAFAKEKSKALRELNNLKSTGKAGVFSWPLPNAFRVSSNFGYRIHPITGKKKLHAGTDMAAPKGTKVQAAAGGVVIVAKWWGGYGNAVIVDHLNGYWTLYGHMSKISVKEDQQVKKGQKLGEVGSTGASTGNHLHYEVRKNSVNVDPMKYTSRP